ncbi:hypothetical protein RV14_GL000331 [Enterococcus ratti]|uniref:Uncharacterized protein n=1 Tax=Enterococcus ratti TaxID=150033 RepID=A0A1L8WJI6_9ENTE|nr:hypothetical protein RV14_GL000331 [Enterococcus ratti]
MKNQQKITQVARSFLERFCKKVSERMFCGGEVILVEGIIAMIFR